MKQVLQDLKTGEVTVVEAPEPAPASGRLLVRVRASLLSAGTESALVAKGRQSLLSKLREKPQLLRQGLDELKERGLSGVKERLASKFEGFAELGYSCAGTVVDNGGEIDWAPLGSLVACAGAGVANHSEFVSVPKLLTAVIPEGVSLESAAYTTVGAIAMQGVRQSGVQLGEHVAVIGLGLVGLITVQLLRATGCRVVGIDPSARAREHGLSNGCSLVSAPEEAAGAVLTLSKGLGADVVIICAATPDNSPVELAGKLARSGGRVTMVGSTGMTIPREDYYLKELSFTLSRSYGPGRYDRRYEEGGQDYPPEYVRFTEQRNMCAFLDLLQQRRVETAGLTTHRFPIEKATSAYELLNDRGADRIGILLEYSAPAEKPTRFSIQLAPPKPVQSGQLGVGFIGAGAYAQSLLLPLLRNRPDIALRSVMTRSGSHALHVAKRFGFQSVCTRVEEVLTDPSIQVVFITTRHDSHATLACEALRAGKHVWVEKPLALSLEQLKAVVGALRENPKSRMVVGFNRPFSRSSAWLREKMSGSPRPPSTPKTGSGDQDVSPISPLMMLYRVNAGYIPPNSWVHDPQEGGGRLLGEGCHFFDFVRFFAGSAADSVSTEALGGGRADLQAAGNFAATVRFRNGSVAQLLYTAEGATGMGKEYFECFAGQACGSIDDYKSAAFWNQGGPKECPRHPQDKGQASMLQAFISGLASQTPPPLSIQDMLESSLLTLAAQQSLIQRRPVDVAELRALVS